MTPVLQIASYIADRYKQEFGQTIDEMKLHKLLYFTQREAVIQLGEPMFDAQFRAWKYGPVLLAVREAYRADRLHDMPTQEDIDKYKAVFDYVFREFAPSKTTTLVTLSHGESSWKKARIGYGKYDTSDVPMSMEDIRRDAEAAAKLRQEQRSLRKLQTYLDEHKSQLSHIYLY